MPYRNKVMLISAFFFLFVVAVATSAYLYLNRGLTLEIVGPDGSIISRMIDDFAFEELGTTNVKIDGEEGEVVTLKVENGSDASLVTVVLNKQTNQQKVDLDKQKKPVLSQDILGGDTLIVYNKNAEYLSGRIDAIMKTPLISARTAVIYDDTTVEELTWVKPGLGYFADGSGEIFKIDTTQGSQITSPFTGSFPADKGTNLSSNSAGKLAFKSSGIIYVFDGEASQALYSSPYSSPTPYRLGLSNNGDLALHQLLDRDLTEYEAGEDAQIEEFASSPQEIIVIQTNGTERTIDIPYDDLFLVRALVWSPSGNKLAIVGPYNIFLIEAGSDDYSLLAEYPRSIGTVAWLDENKLIVQNENSLWLTDVASGESKLLNLSTSNNFIHSNSIYYDSSTQILYTSSAGRYVTSPSKIYGYTDI